MNLKITRADVWTAEIDDQPGGLARTLRAVADYGADLDYVVARRDSAKPGKGRLFVSPLTGRQELDNADQVGLRRATDAPTLKIEGTNEPGMGSKLTRTIADAGVSMHSLSAAVIGHHFVCYAVFDTVQDLEKAEAVLHAISTHHWWSSHRTKVA